MRNPFDQYQQPENKLTHALVSTLSLDRELIRPFLRWAGIDAVPPVRGLRNTEQQVPGDPVAGDESESKGLPDACIYDDDGWVVLFESKVQSGLHTGQLSRHIATAKRHGYEKPHLIVIAVDRPRQQLPRQTLAIEWRHVYQWFRGQADRSVWAAQLVDYMQVFEARMIAQEYSIRGTLTMFDGLRFNEDNPYTYREGKRLIRLLGDDLQKRKELIKLGVDPTGQRRSAITGRRGDAVWDYLPLKKARGAGSFTQYPHLTIDISRAGPGAAITVPNGVKGGLRTALRELGSEGFRALMKELERRVRPVIRRSRGSRPRVYVTQRHYRSQRSRAEMDGRLNVDLRTLVQGGRDGVKHQPQWIDAIYNLLCGKRSNMQFAAQLEFSYDCPLIRSPRAAELFVAAWKAYRPLLDFVLAE